MKRGSSISQHSFSVNPRKQQRAAFRRWQALPTNNSARHHTDARLRRDQYITTVGMYPERTLIK